MPQATVSIEPVRKDLTTAPPDGFVVLRRMPYGKYLARQEMALKLKVQAQQGQGKGKSAFEGELGMANKLVTLFEFKECIVEHNLTGEDGQLLNFAQPHTIEILDPRIGNEIGTLINELHDFESGNSSTASDTSSSEAAKTQQEKQTN